MRLRMQVLIVLVLLAPVGSSVVAQQPQRARQGAVRPERDSLERQVRVRMGQILKTRLGLTDDQMTSLQATNRRIEERRRELFQQEREVRTQLRDAMRVQDTTRNAEIAGLLDRMITVQRQRVELLEQEQRELATFLTPMQRARYFGMEEQIRRRMTEMRDNDRGGPRRPGQGGVPGKRPPSDRPPAGAPPG